MLGEHLIVFVAGMGLCTAVTLGVAAVEHRCGRPFAVPQRAPHCRRAWAWLQAELRRDYAAARAYGLGEVGRALVETVVALGLVVRCLLHVLVVFVAAPDGDHDADWHLRADPITSPRPAWNRWLARGFTALLGVWMTRAYPMHALDPALNPVVLVAAKAWMAANVAVLVADPAVELGVSFANRTQMSGGAL